LKIQLYRFNLNISAQFLILRQIVLIMGKGDQRSRRGKIWKGTYGKTRPQSKKLPWVAAQTDKKNKAAK
jgi:30S ribosomal protein S31